jgi:hypothetical protein
MPMDTREQGPHATQAIADRLQRALEAVRESISRELCAIPTPVPGCDVHFNRLLEDRSKVVDELQRLTKLRAKDRSAQALIEFTRACGSLDPGAAESIVRALADVPPS